MIPFPVFPIVLNFIQSLTSTFPMLQQGIEPGGTIGAAASNIVQTSSGFPVPSGANAYEYGAAVIIILVAAAIIIWWGMKANFR